MRLRTTVPVPNDTRYQLLTAPVPQLGRTLLTARRRVLGICVLSATSRSNVSSGAAASFSRCSACFLVTPASCNCSAFVGELFPIVGAGCRSVRAPCFVSSAAESARPCAQPAAVSRGVELTPPIFGCPFWRVRQNRLFVSRFTASSAGWCGRIPARHSRFALLRIAQRGRCNRSTISDTEYFGHKVASSRSSSSVQLGISAS